MRRAEEKAWEHGVQKACQKSIIGSSGCNPRGKAFCGIRGCRVTYDSRLLHTYLSPCPSPGRREESYNRTQPASLRQGEEFELQICGLSLEANGELEPHIHPLSFVGEGGA